MTPSEQIEKRVAEFLEICQRHGVKATHQRTEILRELAGSEEHPDAETILARVRRKIPAISVDTIYRTLRLFEESGVIARVGSMRDRARFDANTDRHHHFVCTKCGMIGDFYSDAMDRLSAPREVAEMGVVEGVYVELRGVCRKCHQKQRKRRSPRKETIRKEQASEPGKSARAPGGQGRHTIGGVRGI